MWIQKKYLAVSSVGGDVGRVYAQGSREEEGDEEGKRE